ncbi:MAG: TraC family protein [Candidatus Nomurabacteria bacterium]
MIIKNATQSFVPINEIRNGIVILNDGSMRALISCSSLNLSLKGEDEQMGIITGFQSFLNSLDFNIQIFLQSTKLDIRGYLELLKERQKLVEEDLLKIQIKEYIEFIQKFTEEQNIMTKSFYIVVPYEVPSLSSSAKTMTEGEFMKNESQLLQRVSIVTGGLTSLGLKLELVKTEEVVNLFYKLFNPNELDTPVLNSNQ